MNTGIRRPTSGSRSGKVLKCRRCKLGVNLLKVKGRVEARCTGCKRSFTKDQIDAAFREYALHIGQQKMLKINDEVERSLR